MDNANMQTPRGTHRSTIYDVAQEAGVSTSTVSHVINNTATITEATRQRVLQAIEHQRYIPNVMAKTLRRQQSKIIGLVVQDMTSQFYSILYEQLLLLAQEYGYMVFLICGQNSEEMTRKHTETLIEHQVEGLIYVGGGHTSELLQSVEERGISVVLCDQYSPNFPCVEFNNFETMRRLVHAYYADGARRQIYVGVQHTQHENLEQRIRGFECGLEDEGGSPQKNIIILNERDSKYFKYNEQFYAFTDYLQSIPQEDWPEVVYTAHDAIAQVVISTAINLGVRIPEDMRVIGFDDTSHSYFNVPNITTVHQDALELANETFKMLIHQIKKTNPLRHKVIIQKIVLRQSAPIPIYLLEREGLSVLKENKYSTKGQAGKADKRMDDDTKQG